MCSFVFDQKKEKKRKEKKNFIRRAFIDDVTFKLGV
jgi:hypothetical protein